MGFSNSFLHTAKCTFLLLQGTQSVYSMDSLLMDAVFGIDLFVIMKNIFLFFPNDHCNADD